MSNTNSVKPKKTLKTFYISTIFSISLVLVMVGLLGLIVLHGKNLSNFVKENIVLNVVIKENAGDNEIFTLQSNLEKNESIKSTQFISKESAAKNLSNDLGEDFVKFLGYNPLSASIDVYLKADFANKERIQKLVTKLKKKEIVKDVIYQESLIDMVNENLKSISLVIIAFGFTLLLIAIALINNTIRLAMYSQRFIIRSMQLVGATKGFIRKPYIVSGMIHGLLGGIVAILLLLSTLYIAKTEMPELAMLQNYVEFGFLFAAIILMGIIISIFSTYFAVNKYLNQHIDDLYKK
jgi:cell division transport system permease protein